MLKLWHFVVLSLGISHQVDATCQQRQSIGFINQVLLLEDLAQLSSEHMSGRKTGSVGSAKAQSYLQKRYKQIGLSSFAAYPEYLQAFSFSSSDSPGVNILGLVKGQNFPDRFIIVTAHYDHLGKKGHKVFYGADDNASGVATLLALAAKTAEVPLAHSVIFLATDAEEKGLYGAKAFVKQLPIPHNSLLLNINLDMLGYGGRKNRLYATHSRGDKNLKKLVANVANLAPLCLINGHRKSTRFRLFDEKINWRKSSDHWAFGEGGFRYIFLGGGVHKNYHTTEDKFENIEQDFYVSASEAAWLILQAADAD